MRLQSTSWRRHWRQLALEKSMESHLPSESSCQLQSSAESRCLPWSLSKSSFTAKNSRLTTWFKRTARMSLTSFTDCQRQEMTNTFQGWSTTNAKPILKRLYATLQKQPLTTSTGILFLHNWKTRSSTLYSNHRHSFSDISSTTSLKVSQLPKDLWRRSWSGLSPLFTTRVMWSCRKATRLTI